MQVLVTGATGFLGRHLIKKLRDLKWDISISNTKIASLSNIENLYVYNDKKFDYIFHLAAKTKAGDYCLYHKGEQWIDNQIINTNILKYWKDYQPQAKMIAMGTSCSYSPNCEILKEDNYLLGEPESGLYTYAMTKRMLLVGLQSISHQYGLNWVYLIPSTLFGPDFELEDSHFIFDLIKKIHAGKYQNSEVELWGDGYQKRELVYVDDAVEALLKLKDETNQIFNLGSGVEYSIRHFAKLICEEVGYDDNKIIYNTEKYVGVKSKKLCNLKLQEYIGDKDFNDLQEAIKKTINYYHKITE